MLLPEICQHHDLAFVRWSERHQQTENTGEDWIFCHQLSAWLPHSLNSIWLMIIYIWYLDIDLTGLVIWNAPFWCHFSLQTQLLSLNKTQKFRWAKNRARTLALVRSRDLCRVILIVDRGVEDYSRIFEAMSMGGLHLCLNVTDPTCLGHRCMTKKILRCSLSRYHFTLPFNSKSLFQLHRPSFNIGKTEISWIWGHISNLFITTFQTWREIWIYRILWYLCMTKSYM